MASVPGRALVDRVEAAAETGRSAGRRGRRNAEREHLAGADSLPPDESLRANVIERADLIVLAPAAPVLEFSVASPIAFFQR